MTILETFIKLRDDLKTWVTNNLNQKANISYVDEKFDSISEFDPTDIQNAINANTAAIDTKVDKVDGMGLSTNDYTTIEKNKLEGIEEGANRTVVDSEMSETSTNPVQNKVVHAKIETLQSDLTVVDDRVSVIEAWHEGLVEVTEEEIDSLFA